MVVFPFVIRVQVRTTTQIQAERSTKTIEYYKQYWLLVSWAGCGGSLCRWRVGSICIGWCCISGCLCGWIWVSVLELASPENAIVFSVSFSVACCLSRRVFPSGACWCPDKAGSIRYTWVALATSWCHKFWFFNTHEGKHVWVKPTWETFVFKEARYAFPKTIKL